MDAFSARLTRARACASREPLRGIVVLHTESSSHAIVIIIRLQEKTRTFALLHTQRDTRVPRLVVQESMIGVDINLEPGAKAGRDARQRLTQVREKDFAPTRADGETYRRPGALRPPGRSRTEAHGAPAGVGGRAARAAMRATSPGPTEMRKPAIGGTAKRAASSGLSTGTSCRP